MLDPRLSFLNPNHPFSVSYRLNRRKSRLTLIVDTPDGIAGRLVTVIETVLGLAHQLDRAERSAARTIRTDQTIKAWEKRKDAVRRAYRKLRGLGVAHRAAVRAVSEQPAFDDLRNAHNWTRRDFSACIGRSSLYQSSVDPGPQSVPIRAVPVLIPKQAKRTLVGACRMMGGNPS